MDEIKMRKCQVKQNSKWIDIDFNKLKKGDVFRLFEPDGKEVVDKHGNMEFLVTYLNKDKDTGILKSVSIESQQKCDNCKFYDGCCCMYDCRVVAIFDTEESAEECNWFKLGFYNQDELEKTDYR